MLATERWEDVGDLCVMQLGDMTTEQLQSCLDRTTAELESVEQSPWHAAARETHARGLSAKLDDLCAVLEDRGGPRKVATTTKSPPRLSAPPATPKASALPAILGYAAIFGWPYRNVHGLERVEKGCFDAGIQSGKSIAALIDHDDSLSLGTTEAELSLSVDNIGLLAYLRPAPGRAGEQLLAAAMNGQIRGMSWNGPRTRTHRMQTCEGNVIRIVQAELTEVTFAIAGQPANIQTCAALVSHLQNAPERWSSDRVVRRLIQAAKNFEP